MLRGLIATFGLALAAARGGGGGAGETASAALKPGDTAPPFALPGSDGNTYRLEDYKGKRAVVLAWFPKAFTGG